MWHRLQSLDARFSIRFLICFCCFDFSWLFVAVVALIVAATVGKLLRLLHCLFLALWAWHVRLLWLLLSLTLFVRRKLKTLTILSAFLSLHISGLNCRLAGWHRVKPGTGQDRQPVHRDMCVLPLAPLCTLCAFLNCNLINNSQLFCCLNSIYIKCLFTCARFVICNCDELRLGIVLLSPPHSSLPSALCTPLGCAPAYASPSSAAFQYV